MDDKELLQQNLNNARQALKDVREFGKVRSCITVEINMSNEIIVHINSSKFLENVA